MADKIITGQTLGERIKNARMAAGLSAKRLEEVAELPAGIVSRLESGKRGKRPTADTLGKLAETLGVTPEWIGQGVEMPDGARSPARRTYQPTLESVPGYADAEIEVARLERDVPVEIFKQARLVRFAVAPEVITVSYLRALVRFLANGDWEDETAAIREKIQSKRRPRE